jgi:hypothetical protein
VAHTMQPSILEEEEEDLTSNQKEDDANDDGGGGVVSEEAAVLKAQEEDRRLALQMQTLYLHRQSVESIAVLERAEDALEREEARAEGDPHTPEDELPFDEPPLSDIEEANDGLDGRPQDEGVAMDAVERARLEDLALAKRMVCMCTRGCLYAWVCVYLYMYAYVFLCVYIYVCIYGHTRTGGDVRDASQQRSPSL